MKELTRDQIIKALECCADIKCEECPMPPCNCEDILREKSLALIMKLSEEKYDIELSYKALERDNERLNKNRMELEQKCASFTSESIEKCASVRADTVRKMQERLKKECLIDRGYEVLLEGTIDQIAKEMLEAKP